MFDNKQLETFYRYCYSLTLNESNAYDLLQNALEKFLRSKAKKNNKIAFMYTIIRHQFIDDYRKDMHYNLIDFEESKYLDIDVKTLEEMVIDGDLVEQVLHYLEPIEREILFYWAIEGYSTQQIASLLDMPKGTVLSKIHRMRQRIKQRFNDDTLVESFTLNEEAKK